MSLLGWVILYAVMAGLVPAIHVDELA